MQRAAAALERRSGRFAAIAVSLFVTLASDSSAQAAGSVEGRVTDGAGAPVASAVVTARNLANGFRQSAISDASGVYRIQSLPAGLYDVTAEVSGFTTGLSSGVSVAEGATAVADFTLKAVVFEAPRPLAPPSPVEPLPPAPQGQAGAVPAVPVRAGPRMEIYGFAQLDLIYDFDQINPDWFDVERPTQLPSFPNEFGENGNFWASVRQTRFGVKGWLPTGWGEVKTLFDFDLFGVGEDAGQTTFHLQNAFGELGAFLMGQTDSVFMDGDVFPNSIEYWGPNGMVFFRNVQLRWAPMQGENQIFVALERPGASGDGGRVQDRVDLQNIKGHNPAPDLTFHYRRNGDWGHVQLAGILRYIGWVDTVPDEFDLTGHAVGWGLNLSTNYKLGETGTIRASVVYGEGIENYMNDAPVDIGAAIHLGNPRRPIVGEALPVFGLVAFYDFYWNDYFSSAIGYSRVDIDNSNLQLPSAFKTGQYALANLLYYPVENVMTGFEFLWGRRTNFSDGFAVDDFRLQFSGRYSFDFELGSKK
jgi:DcaP outer membrane protein/Carboxypeptidase regulatory-like domain